MTQSRRPSPLQRRVLIVLAALDEKRPGPVLTRDIERVLERSGKPRSTGQTCAPPAVAWRAIRWKWRSGCRPVTMQEWRFVCRLMKASPRKNTKNHRPEISAVPV